MEPSRFIRSATSALSLAALAIAASGCSQSAAPAVPVIGSFAATPASILPGASSLLSWTVSGASSLSIDHGVGGVTGTSISVTPATTTTYRLTATNGAGTATADATVTVVPPAGLGYSANPATYVVGAAIVDNIPSSTGSPVASYGVAPALPIGLVLDTVTGIVSGTPLAVAPLTVYTVTATNSAGSTTVALRITVTSGTAPVITTQPASQAVVPPATATFAVVATGSGPLSYQWRRNDTVIDGATAASYTTLATASADSGSIFTVVVSDAFGGSVTSTAATLLVQGFKATGTMTTARESHAATRLASGKVLVTGGYSGQATLRSAEVYDPATGTFTATGGTMTTARQGHSAALLADGKVLVVGGYSGTAYLASAETYDPATGTFTAVTSVLPEARADFAAITLAGGKVLIAGGNRGSGTAGVYLSTAALFDPVASTFAATGSMSSQRSEPAAVLLQGGLVLVAGGRSSVGVSASAELFDPAGAGGAGTFASTGSMTSARELQTATLLANGSVIVTGGQNASGDLQTADLYGPAAGTFLATGAMGTRRAFQTASLLPNGKVLVAGGSSGASVLRSVEFYDPAAATFAAVASQDMVTPRYKQTATPLADGRVLVIGGIGPTVPLASAEVFTPIP
jgi:hypothetical protein